MLVLIRRLLEMIRFSHTIFALPFALSAAVLAWQLEPFRWLDLVGILLAMITARSAAMAFNRIVDRHFDADNPRTATRHLPSGTLSLTTVVVFTLLAAALFVASTALFWLREPPNPWPSYLAVPVLAFLCGYSWTKRFTVLAHFWLGAALMLAPLAAWIAIRGLDFAHLADLRTPAILGLAVLFWVAGFDILYACQDVEFDRRAQLHSVPAWLGVARALRVAAACHLIMFLLLLLLPYTTRILGVIYWTGLVGIGGLLVYEHAIVRPNDLRRVNQAFFYVNGVVSVGLFMVILMQLAWSRS